MDPFDPVTRSRYGKWRRDGREPTGLIRAASQHSHASLENVTRVRLFYRLASRLCMGMLLYYGNGGQRVLSQCRLPVDSSEAYTRPSQFHRPSGLSRTGIQGRKGSVQ